MQFFKPGKTAEITSASGTLRVTIVPKPHWLSLLIEAIALVLFAIYTIHQWAAQPLWFRALLVWGIGSGTAAVFYQLSGTEMIEFDPQKLVISKQVLGWTRVREYPIAECSELESARPTENNHSGLQCKVGWRKVKFGDYMSEDEAIEVLTALQNTLPDVAQKLGATTEGRKHIITLGL
jgi:hypothetical protein